MPFFGKIDNSWGGFTPRDAETGNPFQTGWSHDIGAYNVNGGGSGSYWIIVCNWTNGITNYGYNVRSTTFCPIASSNLNYASPNYFARTSIFQSDENGLFCTYNWHTGSTAGYVRAYQPRYDANNLSPAWQTASAANSSNGTSTWYDFF